MPVRKALSGCILSVVVPRSSCLRMGRAGLSGRWSGAGRGLASDGSGQGPFGGVGAMASVAGGARSRQNRGGSGGHAGDCLADVAVLLSAPELFGPIASDPTVSR